MASAPTKADFDRRLSAHLTRLREGGRTPDQVELERRWVLGDFAGADSLAWGKGLKTKYGRLSYSEAKGVDL